MNDAELLKYIRKIVKKQAEDEGLWFKPQYITESYLQEALRKLHAIIEGDFSPFWFKEDFPELFK